MKILVSGIARRADIQKTLGKGTPTAFKKKTINEMFVENINFENYFLYSDFKEVRDVMELIIENAIEYKVVSDFMLTKKEVFDIFNTRFEIQKFVTKKDTMKGYEHLLFNVSEISDDTVLRVVAMKAHPVFMQFFINNTNEELLGILWKK